MEQPRHDPSALYAVSPEFQGSSGQIFGAFATTLGMSTAQYRPHLTQHAANRAEYLRPQPDQQHDEEEDDHENHDWMEGGESRKPYREYIFDNAQEDIRERLRTCVGRNANTRFGSVRAERESAAGEQGHSANGWVEMGEGRSGQYCARGHADERVDRVPNGIDHRDLVDHELDEIEGGRDANHPPAANEIKVAGQLHQMEALQQAESQHSGVEVEAREPCGSQTQAECR
jgi:hypothetical protein